jgi:hypothetical protein
MINLRPYLLLSNQCEVLDDFTERAEGLLGFISDYCLPGRETDIAVQKLEECVMFVRRSIALNPNVEPI